MLGAIKKNYWAGKKIISVFRNIYIYNIMFSNK